MSSLNTTIKLSSYCFDSEKKPELYAKWESGIMPAVESSEHGPPLNAFLCDHWGIDKANISSTPECMAAGPKRYTLY